MQARALVSSLGRRRFDHQLGMDRTWVDLGKEPAAVLRIFELCSQEVYEAIAPDAAGRVFCNLWLILDPTAGKMRLAGNTGVVYAGISRAVRAALRRKDRDVADLVKSGVASELARRRDERIAAFQELKAREILPPLLRGLSNGQHKSVEVYVEHLTPEQRSDFVEELHIHLGGDPLIGLRMDREPDDPHEWLFWHLRLSDMETLVKRGYEDSTRGYVMSARRGFVRSSKKGEAGIISPLGPMFARVYKELGRELSKHGHPIDDPGSVNRIAKSLNVSQPTAAAWLKEDLPGLTITPNGKGGVVYSFNISTVQRSMEIARGKKRGPGAQRS